MKSYSKERKAKKILSGWWRFAEENWRMKEFEWWKSRMDDCCWIISLGRTRRYKKETSAIEGIEDPEAGKLNQHYVREHTELYTSIMEEFKSNGRVTQREAILFLQPNSRNEMIMSISKIWREQFLLKSVFFTTPH